jgi:hypothetical protein
MESHQTMLWFALEKVFVKIQTHAYVLLDTQEINVKLQFVMENWIQLLAQVKMEPVHQKIIVLVIISTREMNANNHFVLE